MRPAALLYMALIGVVLVSRTSATRLDQLLTVCHQGLDCDKDSGPVCAVDATGLPKTFADSCKVLLENCISTKNFAVVKKGEC